MTRDDLDQLAIDTIRTLSTDAVQQPKSARYVTFQITDVAVPNR